MCTPSLRNLADPLAADEKTMQRLIEDAFSHAAREFHQKSFFCKPSNAEEHAECRAARAISRDVLAQLIVHCDDADGALWDRKQPAAPTRHSLLSCALLLLQPVSIL